MTRKLPLLAGVALAFVAKRRLGRVLTRLTGTWVGTVRS